MEQAIKDYKAFVKNIEGAAQTQIDTLLMQDVFDNSKIRIMPDCHAGAGCVIGFTANLGEKVVPNLVGVDIGCGVLTVKIKSTTEGFDLEKLDEVIKSRVPAGFNVHTNQNKEELAFAQSFIDRLYCKNELQNTSHLLHSLGTLGGGNHFIEVGKSESGDMFLFIHTGSRNLGSQVAKIYQKKAIAHTNKRDNKALIEQYKAEGREAEIEQALKELRDTTPKIPDDLAFLDGVEREQYLHDMRVCQEFAHHNRVSIANTILTELSVLKDGEVLIYRDVPHNYIDAHNIVRKGAISAHKDVFVAIPLNMREGVIIGYGKGNEDWNYSAPHGAGRIMSRVQARAQLKLEDFKKQMTGIYTTTADETTIDESPEAYKNAQEIIDAIGDTVSIVDIVKPIYNFKASEKLKKDWSKKNGTSN